ncbi:MAG: SUMF1/EgtB/PvdO family nonheme iron enzyme [Thermoanaerobaculia bacterium]|nr:SUMF1/EgtB/PvdO family nonheme iron enzyme [Thermoanaerobaculia bacterium]
MKLTPLGKLLLFLIGLGLVVTAVYRFVPPEQLPWNRPQAAPPSGTEVRQEGRPAEKAAEKSRPAADAQASNKPWIAVPAGLFASGPDQSEIDVPPFSIERTEVTNGRYEEFLEACPRGSACGPRELPSYWEDRAYLAGHRDNPVVFVAWSEAASFCRWSGGRLPTAIEWEKAARGTDGRSYPTGNVLDPATANILGAERHDEKSAAAKQIPTWPVTDSRYARDRSPYGVLGMAGNVSEWTASASEEEPDLRLVAGGSWDSWELSDGRTYNRIPKSPADRSSSLGFRCAKSQQ